MIILDTNVVSEVVRPAPAPEVLRWFAVQPASGVFITTITQAEILYGLEVMPKGKRRTNLQSAIETIFGEDFADRVLPFDSDAARAFASIAASRWALGRPIAQLDAQIAAIARSRGGTLATRDAHDFEHCGIRLVNPWTG
jgi:predicted nucleic acid-binding protein